MAVRTTVKSIQDIMRQDSGVDGDAQRISQLCWMFFLKIIDDQDQQLEMMQDGYRSPIPKTLQWRSWASDPEGITGDELLTFVNSELFPKLKSLSVAGGQGDRRRVVRDVFEDAYNYMKSGQLMRQVVNKINEVDFNNLAERQHFGDIYEQILNDLQSAGNAGEYYTPRAVTAFMAERLDPHPGEILLDPACGTGGFLTCAIRHMRDHYVKTVEDEQAMQQGLRAVEKKQLPHMLCVTNMLLHGIENPSFVRHDNTLARPYISYGASDRVDIVLTNPPFGGREEDGIESNFPKHFQTRETADLFLALIIRILKPGGRAAVVLPDGSLFGEGVKTRLKEHLMEECNLHTIVRLPNSVFKPYANLGTNLFFFEKGVPTSEIWFYEHRVPETQKAYSITRPIRIEHLKPCIDWWGGRERRGRVENEVAWRVTAEEVRARNYNLDFRNPHVVCDQHADPETLVTQLNGTERNVADLRTQLSGILGQATSALGGALFKYFEQISEATDAIPRLRRFIFDLAVRGKLVEQSPEEEPASELLKRLEAKQPGWPRTKKNTKGISAGVLDTTQHPFPLASGWQWIHLGTLVRSMTNGIYKPASFYADDGVLCLRMYNIKDGRINFDNSKRINLTNEELETYRLLPGDLLVNRVNSRELVGKAAAIPHHNEPIIFESKNIRVRFATEELVHYANLVFQTVFYRTILDGYAKQACGQATVSQPQLSALPFPLPPLSEQWRIVQKVEQLMRLCDQLAVQLSATQSQKSTLLESILFHSLNHDDRENQSTQAKQAEPRVRTTEFTVPTTSRMP